ncbi:MAG TPA: hypothetical protein VEI06_10825 [Gemmatimonadaceae bacterium]|nr:hypothetical protein [Gemmatimonadaceae bacterium]
MHTLPSVLDPSERVQEITFGVLMALTFTGTFSVVNAGREETSTMLTAALGCNLAWGLTDAVGYLVSTAVERRRRATLLEKIQATPDRAEAHHLISGEMSDQVAAHADESAVEALRHNLERIPIPAVRFTLRDLAGALGVFLLVVAATFPVALPFLVIGDPVRALRVSNGLALATLFAGGFYLGRYSGGSPLRYGLAMTALGVVVVAIIIALGG